MQRIGLVLSGGGARAIAHLGVLRALEEQGIRPAVIAGASAGALIGALYAAGSAPDEIKDIFQKTSWFGLSHLLLGRSGLFSMDAMRSALEEHLSAKTFEELPIPLHVSATNLTEGRSEILSSGGLIEPLLASACVPVVFQPVRYRDCDWVDGGLLNNLPADALAGRCDSIIGSHVNRLGDRLSSARDLHKAQLLERCFHLGVARGVYEKATLCDIFLDHPGLSAFGMFDMHSSNRIFRLGYEYAQRLLPAAIVSLPYPLNGQ